MAVADKRKHSVTLKIVIVTVYPETGGAADAFRLIGLASKPPFVDLTTSPSQLSPFVYRTFFVGLLLARPRRGKDVLVLLVGIVRSEFKYCPIIYS